MLRQGSATGDLHSPWERIGDRASHDPSGRTGPNSTHGTAIQHYTRHALYSIIFTIHLLLSRRFAFLSRSLSRLSPHELLTKKSKKVAYLATGGDLEVDSKSS